MSLSLLLSLSALPRHAIILPQVCVCSLRQRYVLGMPAESRRNRIASIPPTMCPAAVRPMPLHITTNPIHLFCAHDEITERWTTLISVSENICRSPCMRLACMLVTECTPWHHGFWVHTYTRDTTMPTTTTHFDVNGDQNSFRYLLALFVMRWSACT